MTFPRDDQRRLRDAIKELKSTVRRLSKENRMLREELEQNGGPERLERLEPRKPKRDLKELIEDDKGEETVSKDEWRQKFIKEFKPKNPRQPKGNGNGNKGEEEDDSG